MVLWQGIADALIKGREVATMNVYAGFQARAINGIAEAWPMSASPGSAVEAETCPLMAPQRLGTHTREAMWRRRDKSIQFSRPPPGMPEFGGNRRLMHPRRPVCIGPPR
jgi:hypothetical protein